jgi:uncharacterized protein YciI
MKPIFALLFAAFASLAAEYPLCFLVSGPQSGKFPPEAAKDLQARHMAHINRMWEAKALESAGPVASLPGSRGILLFRGTLEQAQKLASEDPKVKAGDLALECSLWEGPNHVGTAYREAYGKPGFKEQMSRKVAVLLREGTAAALGQRVIAGGPLHHAKFHYFAVLDTADLNAVKDKAPVGEVFHWFHDPQVWPVQ